ncbi:putative phage abortive infection protein [Pseudomonas sp. PS02290]|uniref:putative phage abortive infection protein n=1 Tax=Pseudomonas sp. PS02290 TaxID=2991430 RepID=UPI00249C47D4|nr:putative phage abortive infection protein [Pseudomonas sp. PS02290]
MRITPSTGSIIAVGVVAIIVTYISYFIFLLTGYGLGVKELSGVRSGTFGDAFGTLNALFSGLAFSGVLITLYYQRKDLEASQVQNKKQQAESQFYNMLNLQQQVIQGFDLHRMGEHAHTIQGRDCFRDWQRKLRVRYSELMSASREGPSIEAGIEAYQKILKAHQGDLGLYFRSTYSVFRFIDGVEEDQKKHLGAVARSLMSDYELVFLFYNCLSQKGKKFNRFANMYALFDNLDVSLLLDKEHIIQIDKASLGDNDEAHQIRDMSRP